MPGRIALLIVVFLAVNVHAARTQIIDPGMATQPSTGAFGFAGGSYYNFSSGTGCDLNVSVWGFVGNPGRYKVPCETNLLELLSYCGGPSVRGAEPYMDKVKVIRRGGVNRENEIKEVFEVDLSKYLLVTDIPAVTTELLLFPGDLIIVDGEETITVDILLRVAQIVVAIAQILTSLLALYTIVENTK